MSAGDWLLLLVAGVAGGLAGSIAGLASVATYPALLATGLGPVAANVTNTVSLLAYTAGSVTGSRPELTGQAPRARRLGAAALLGGAAGCGLLLLTPERTFERIAPLLIAGASLAIMARPRPRPQPQPGAGHGDAVWLPVGVFLVGIYGGYFGAGIGILMLAALGLLGLADIHQMNGLKNLMAIFINGIAAVYFIVSGAVLWSDVAIMAAGSVLGGLLGPRLARRLGRVFVRRFVIGVGFTMAIVLAVVKR